MQIYMICGIGLCLRVGKKNFMWPMKLLEPILFIFGVENYQKATTTYVFSKEKKNSKMSHQFHLFKFFLREHVATSLFTTYNFLMVVYKNMN